MRTTPRTLLRTRTTLAIGTAAVTAAGLLVTTMGGPANGAGRPGPAGPVLRAIANTAPTWTASATDLGRARRSGTVRARIYLAPRGGMAALQRKAIAVSTPGSPQYGRFLSPQRYYAEFAPTAAAVGAVRQWVRASGLRVAGVAAHNDYVLVRGSVAAAEQAFDVRLNRFRTDGRIVRAPLGAVSVPAAVRPSVLTVLGLDTRPALAHPLTADDAPPSPGFRNAHPCSRFFGQLTAKYKADFTTKLPKFRNTYLPYAPCGYTGTQLRGAYEHHPATSTAGHGITVAITDAFASPTIRRDAGRYAHLHGDGSYAPGQFTQKNPATFTHEGACGASGWYGEETLDVEAVHAMAPGANIRYYGQRSCTDVASLDTFDTVLNENKAQLVTNSWGWPGEVLPTGTIAAFTKIFLRGATQGVSFLFSSGDDGDELANTGIKQPDDLASNPYVTAVGGTATAIGYSNRIQYQTAWGTNKFDLGPKGQGWTPEGFIYGGGGGASSEWNKPAYQKGVAPGTSRQVPDVAMDADPQTGMLVGQTQSFPSGVHYGEYRIGGTSLASPLFAGMTAVAFQRSKVSRVGLLNPTIYGHRRTFTDVKDQPRDLGVVRADYANGLNAADGLVYSVRTFNTDSSLHLQPGWDSATGIGVPKTSYFGIFKR